MANINKNANKSTQQESCCTSTFLCCSKLCWCMLLLMFIIFAVLLYHIRYFSYLTFSRILFNRNYINSTNLILFQSENTTASLTKSTTDLPGMVIEMNDRTPSYKLATKNGAKPYADGDRAQAKLLDELHLYEVCQRDPSTIVVDVGAYLGDFGLYAAACGCTVYIFEIQPEMIPLIRSSIKHNSFPSSRVQLFHNAVSDLPSNSTVKFSPADGSTAITDGSVSVQTIRLDDISWSSSSIFLLKVDVEGFELNVLRSAKTLFAEKRISHLIFEYTAWWNDRAPQKTLLPYVINDLKAKYIYALHRTSNIIYGPLSAKHLATFYDGHLRSRLQTDVYAVFDSKAIILSIRTRPYQPKAGAA